MIASFSTNSAIVAKGDLDPAFRKDDAKFVATKAREYMGRAKLLLQRGAHAANQFVAGRVSACVVHELELIEIEEHHHVRALPLLTIVSRKRSRSAGCTSALKAGVSMGRSPSPYPS